LPEDIEIIFISTKSMPLTVIPAVQNFISILLDLTQPSMSDFSRLPTWVTVNETSFEIQADNESWFWGAKSEIDEFFASRLTAVNWLHKAGT
jgi:hypothetical protein